MEDFTFEDLKKMSSIDIVVDPKSPNVKKYVLDTEFDLDGEYVWNQVGIICLRKEGLKLFNSICFAII